MKNSIFLLLILLFISQQTSWAQDNSDSSNVQTIWADRSTETLKPKRKVWPLFGIKKMGAAKNMEWQIQPLFFLISPNLGLKKGWVKGKSGFHFSSLHKVNYPSIYLNLIAREGSGGVLPGDSEIPPIINLRNELLLGYNAAGNYLTVRAGLATAFKLGDADFADIDFPFLYNRTLAFNHTPTLYTGLNFNRDILSRLNLEADFALFKVDFESSDLVFENQLVFFWKKSDKFGLKLGAAAAYGQYPYGFDVRVIPVFDLVFGFGNKRKDSGL